MSWCSDDPHCDECGSDKIRLIGFEVFWSGTVANECECADCGLVFTDPKLEMA